MTTSKPPLLSPEELAAHAQTCQVIFAMWAGQGELLIEPSDDKAVQQLAEYLSLPLKQLGSDHSIKIRDGLPSAIAFSLVTDPFAGTASSSTAAARRLILDVSLTLRRMPGNEPRRRSPPMSLSLRQADWLNRSQQDDLRAKAGLITCGADGQTASEHAGNLADMDEEDGATIVMNAVETLSEAAIEMEERGELAAASSGATQASTESSGPPSSASLSKFVLRAWNHLPSLSTKEKRDDLVSYATSTLHALQGNDRQPLTGFVLAGKPGLVVLECPLPEEAAADPKQRQAALLAATRTLDAYWSSIKSRSWADIPGAHKKVSETHREEYVERAWQDMREMTGAEEIGGKEAMRGGWRNDLGRVEAWLREEKGVGGRLRDVLGADW